FRRVLFRSRAGCSRPPPRRRERPPRTRPSPGAAHRRRCRARTRSLGAFGLLSGQFGSGLEPAALASGTLPVQLLPPAPVAQLTQEVGAAAGVPPGVWALRALFSLVMPLHRSVLLRVAL